MFVFASSHPHIFSFEYTCWYPWILTSSLISLGSCVLAHNLALSHPHTLRFINVSLNPRMLALPYPHVHVCLLVSLHPRILISLGSCVLACILASSHPHTLSFISVSLYPGMRASLYPHVHACLLVSLHPHIFISLGSCVLTRILVSHLTSSYPQVYVCLLVCSHPQVNMFSIRINNFILVSSRSSVLRNCVSHFVNNSQTLRTRQVFVLDFCRTSRKIYWKKTLTVDLNKS